MNFRPTFHRTFFKLAAFGAAAGAFVGPSPLGHSGSSPTSAVEPIRGMVGVGTWRTQAEFKEIKVTKGEKVLFTDDFFKGSERWKLTHGKWEVVDGALRQTGNEEAARALVGDPNWSDYTLTLKARKLGGSEGFLILFGAPDGYTRSWWNLGGWGNTRHGFQAPATSEGQVPGKIETGRWYDVKIELRGDRIRGFLDNKLVQTATQAPGTHTLVFSTEAKGVKKSIPQWGLDTSWPSPDNMRRGLLYMGKDNVDLVRVAFPIDTPLVDGELSAAAREEVDKRARIAVMAGEKPWTMMPHQEGGVHAWYKNGNEVITGRWVQAMAAAQRRYDKKLASVEPFNEPDYGWNQGSLGNLNDIMGSLRTHPDFAGMERVGPSTLSADAAAHWYGGIKGHLHRATTHALAGGMENYIRFFQQVSAEGRVACNPEAHNLVEVLSGAEYGLRSALWWGTAERARGEFVKASDGVRLAYAEDRPRWTAAAVYRAPDGKVQAFAGGSERMASTTRYRFVSKDRDVFFDGYGPQREYTVTIRGGMGYQANQPNAETVVNITWGEDVPPPVKGWYVIVNRMSGKVLGVAGASRENGAAVQQMDDTRAGNQQWDAAPLDAPGDMSYFTLRAVHSGKALDNTDWSHAEGGKVQQWGEGEAAPQQWFFDYVGDHYFYIRNRWSTQYLEPEGGSKSADAAVVQTSRTGTPRQQWRLVPVSALTDRPIDFDPPRRPTGLVATAQSRAVALRWSANHEADLAGYTVFRSKTRGGPYDTIARGVKGNHYIDRGAKDRRTYYYAVKAMDLSLNRSAFSTEVRAIPR